MIFLLIIPAALFVFWLLIRRARAPRGWTSVETSNPVVYQRSIPGPLFYPVQGNRREPAYHMPDHEDRFE